MPQAIPANERKFFFLLSTNWPGRAYRWSWGLVGAFLLWFGSASLPDLFGYGQTAWDNDYAVTHISWDDQDPELRGYLRYPSSPPAAPLIVRKAVLELVAKDLDAARTSIERTVTDQAGEVVDLVARSEESSRRKLCATIRMPAGNFDVALARIKLLGWVKHESHDSKDVRPNLVAAEMRLAEVRTMEGRLLETLRQHTGNLPEIVEVEEKLSELRGEIQNLEAQLKSFMSDVRLAELKLEVEEEFKAPVESPPPSTSVRLRNASVDGYQGLTESALGLAAFVLGAGPALIFWAAVLFFPGRWAWRRVRAALARISHQK